MDVSVSKRCCSHVLPEELVIEILEWLPIKSIVRFRCVAKSWPLIFKNPTFIKNHSRKRGKRGTTLLVRRRLPPPKINNNGNFDVLSFHGFNNPNIMVRHAGSITFLKKSLGFSKIPHGIHLVGPCNGIICIFYSIFVILSNPVLHEYNILPNCFHRDCGGLAAVGFGVADNDEFKVILMHHVYDQLAFIESYLPDVVRCDLYSSRTDSWKQIHNPPVIPVIRSIKDYVFLNGSCHWSGHTHGLHGNQKSILSFDINSEVYGQFELPDSLCRSDIAYPTPITLKDSLLGLVQYQDWFRLPAEPIEIWAMKEYGVKDSWAKMFVLSPQPCLKNLLHWKNDTFLMIHEPKYALPMEQRICDENLVYDENLNSQLSAISLPSGEITKFEVYGAELSMSVLKYQESLVSVL